MTPPAPKARAADWTEESRERGTSDRATREARRVKRAGGAKLRSDAWLRGDDEVALAHRVAFAAAGHPVTADGGQPVIGIANSASELNPCNLPLGDLAGPVADGIRAGGGVPVEFGSISART